MAGLGGLQVSRSAQSGSVPAPASFPPHDHLRHALHQMLVSRGIAHETHCSRRRAGPSGLPVHSGQQWKPSIGAVAMVPTVSRNPEPLDTAIAGVFNPYIAQSVNSNKRGLVKLTRTAARYTF